jgi:hypothetical protein
MRISAQILLLAAQVYADAAKHFKLFLAFPSKLRCSIIRLVLGGSDRQPSGNFTIFAVKCALAIVPITVVTTKLWVAQCDF